MSLIISPKISKADDKESSVAVVQKSAIEQFRLWSPPAVVYSLSTIGRNIVHEGETLRCYTAQEGKRVLMPMFADYRATYRMSWLAVAAFAEYRAKVAALDTKLTLTNGLIATYKDELNNWYEVSKTLKYRLDSKERWSWVPWSMLVTSSLVIGIVGIRNSSK